MEIIRTPFLAEAPVAGAEVLRVESVERDGRFVYETLWIIGKGDDPVTEEDLPY